MVSVDYKVWGIFVLILLAFWASPSTALASDKNADKILSLVNVHRGSIGLPPLSYDPLLNAAAQKRAQEVIARQSLSHEGHRGPLMSEGYFNVRDDNIEEQIQTGENFACGFRRGMNDVVSAWLKSESHLQVLEDGRFKGTGIAVVRGNLHLGKCKHDNDYVIVQMFGSR